MSVALVRPELAYAWKGTALLIMSTRGACGEEEPLSGFYYRETRCVRTLRVEVNGRRPWLCEAALPSPDTLTFSYVYPEISSPGGGGTGQSGDEEKKDADGLPERALDIHLTYVVNVARLGVELLATNRSRQTLTFDLACRIDADFADIQEALAGARQQDSPVDVSVDDEVQEFKYQHPKLPCRTTIRASGWDVVGRDALAGNPAGDIPPLAARLTLAPQETRKLQVKVVPSVDGRELTDPEAQERAAALDDWRSRLTRLEVPGNRLIERILHDNIRDVGSFPLLDGERDEWLGLQAGMPLYPAFFGRDAVTAGWQAAILDRGAALDAALARLGRLQSSRVDEWRDEEPGRIPYQVRSGPLALLNINPYSAYYADFASPLMFVISLANLWAWTGERTRLQRYWDTARRILDWAREYGDADKDGYLEYQTRSTKGTKNQGWKDSGDAIVYDDGSPVPAPIATCELQGYWFIAQQLMALMSGVMGASGDAAEYLRSAGELKERFNRDWWVEDEQFFALALDPDKRRVNAVTSNVGHCLATGIIDATHLAAVVGRMFAPDMFSGWGIRTLSTSHRYYNPLSYHRGTVWAVEQGTIVFGLRRFGFDARASELAKAMFDLALVYPESRIPECVGGYARGERPTPSAYPRANTPQLWNATAFPLVIQSLLGLVPIAAAKTLLIDPILPTWMPDIVLHRLRVGGSSVSLRFWRDADGDPQWEVVHKQGTLHILRQPPPESRSASVVDRLAGVLQSAM